MSRASQDTITAHFEYAYAPVFGAPMLLAGPGATKRWQEFALDAATLAAYSTSAPDAHDPMTPPPADKYPQATALRGTRTLPAAEQPADTTILGPTMGLRLTVTTPRSAAYSPALTDLPVLVFIHGGRYEEGTPDDFDATALAATGCVVVSVGYRLGIPGFAHFVHEEANHFRGVADCQVALEWVSANIESLGGDPTRVILAGHSAGAGIALWLARRDHYSGLFSQVIAFSPAYPAKSFYQTRAWLRPVLGPITRGHLAAKTGSKWAKATARAAKWHPTQLTFGPWPFAAGELANIPTVVAASSEEFFTEPAAAKLDRLPSPVRGLIARVLLRGLPLKTSDATQVYRASLKADYHRPGYSGPARAAADALARGKKVNLSTLVHDTVPAPLSFSGDAGTGSGYDAGPRPVSRIVSDIAVMGYVAQLLQAPLQAIDTVDLTDDQVPTKKAAAPYLLLVDRSNQPADHMAGISAFFSANLPTLVALAHGERPYWPPFEAQRMFGLRINSDSGEAALDHDPLKLLRRAIVLNTPSLRQGL